MENARVQLHEVVLAALGIDGLDDWLEEDLLNAFNEAEPELVEV